MLSVQAIALLNGIAIVAMLADKWAKRAMGFKQEHFTASTYLKFELIIIIRHTQSNCLPLQCMHLSRNYAMNSGIVPRYLNTPAIRSISDGRQRSTRKYRVWEVMLRECAGSSGNIPAR